MVKKLHLNILVHLLYAKALLAEEAHALIKTRSSKKSWRRKISFFPLFSRICISFFFFPSEVFSMISLIIHMVNIYIAIYKKWHYSFPSFSVKL